MAWKSVCASLMFLVAATFAGMSCFLHEWAKGDEGKIGLFQVCTSEEKETCSWLDNDPVSFCNGRNVTDDYNKRIIRMQAAATLMVAGCFLCLFAALVASPVVQRYNYLTATALGSVAAIGFTVSIIVFVTIDRKYYCFTEEADLHYAFGFGLATIPAAIVASILGFQTPTTMLRLWGRVNSPDQEG
ncbi:uncharacterized protein LOC134190908 [Corticium candelabrum]|uniref:uncharacterized protein LOC134190908 n=1 Tax=Corticium candelabrum TaxID=121492 RepID=UPI002E263BD7|nr:uncharacterized protein LOC134190908 [Corticium candelabrum]